ncbi:MAG: Ldh family oxidoreductase, partial [Chitinophagaceae bacterium]|nr:Ldh family oxidoreductase [Chitinophagaceae bacterium]
LSGANYAPWVPPFPAYVPLPSQQPGKGIGHFLGAMRVDAFRPADEFKASMDHWIRGFREAKPAPGQEKVLVPGDPEREMQAERLQQGIPLLPVVWEDLQQLGKRFQLDLPVFKS